MFNIYMYWGRNPLTSDGNFMVITLQPYYIRVFTLWLFSPLFIQFWLPYKYLLPAEFLFWYFNGTFIFFHILHFLHQALVIKMGSKVSDNNMIKILWYTKTIYYVTSGPVDTVLFF